jgi:CheY-like chemotaxis protein
LLGGGGYAVAAAADGAEALEALRRAAPPDLILLDLMMPVLDGWHFRREQLRDPALPAVPVAVVSGAGDADLHAHAIRRRGVP